ncbi:caspase-3-like [Mytilus galloprovincialis]|uniref:caspase-3-like n=1 Tax=Mytilus galloprovincialis TaxID=29158 RepID=UPI003F7B856F
MESMVHTGDKVLSKKIVKDIFARVLNSASSKSKSHFPSNEDEYDSSNRYRGLALIICNENFDTLSQREYCDNEIKLMDETFGKNLNFTVLIFKDLNKEQITWVIHTACKQDDFFRQSDCFTCVLASHGGEEDRLAHGKLQSVNLRDHCIYDVDCIPVITKNIINEFNKVKALKDKPKLFFVQSCRSRQNPTSKDAGKDQGHTIPVHSFSQSINLNLGTDYSEDSYADCPTESKPAVNANHETKTEQEDITDATIFHKLGRMFGLYTNELKDMISILDSSCTDDTLVVYSTASEKYSYGRVNLGGWMLVSLKEAVEEQLRQANRIHRIDFMEVLNAIASNNAHTFETHSKKYPKDPPFKTAVVFEHCFYKELYFYSN